VKNKWTLLLVVIIVAVIIVVTTADYYSTRPDNIPENPYSISTENYENVDASLIKYREVKNIKTDSIKLKGLAFANNRLYLVDEKQLRIITPEGAELSRTALTASPRCITVSDNYIYVGFKEYISQFELSGKLKSNWPPLDPNTVITSLAVKGNDLFIADAGKRRVLRYSINGELLGQFEGKAEEGDLHGFIIPSPNFDLSVNPDGELWVVNPGMHALENYSETGKRITYWQKASFNIDGFSGCCNPAQMAFLPDGSFVTSEKGMVRIKIHKPSGELSCVVAAPDKFPGGMHAPDLTVSPDGAIYALDFDKNLVRIFKRK
jgi:hypothetical protein